MANINMSDPERPERMNPEGVSTSAKSGPSGTSGAQTGQKGNFTFRCADVGFNDCSWETRGSSPDEVLRNAEQHGRQHHNMANIDEALRNQVRSKIRQAA
jgi:predicted small metal-binding protein